MSNSPLYKLPGSSSLSGILLGNGTSVTTSAQVNYSASTNPTINSDQTQGYSIGSQWINTSTGNIFFCTSATTGNANWSSGGGGGSSSFTVTASNSFTIGQVIAFNGTNYVLAEADNVTDAEVVGVVQTATGSVFSFIASGFLLWTSHGFTPGQVLFLSPTVAGGLQNSAPVTVGQVSKPIGIALDANNLRIFDYRAISVGADNTAKNTSEYLTLALDTNLTNSRVLTSGSGVAFTDGGAEGNLTVALDINDLSAAGTLGESDTFPEYNVSSTSNKKITAANLRSLLIGSPQGTIASATTTDLSTVTNDYIQVTGTTAITAFGTPRTGVRKILEFAGALTLTYNATSLIIPGAANVTTAAGDICEVVHEGSGNWRVLRYVAASGKPLISTSVPSNIQTFSSSGTFTPVTTSVMVSIVGGGGGGGGFGNGGTSAGGGGGSGGGGSFIVQNLTLGTGITVTIGSAGTLGSNGGSGAGGNAGSGGTSSFGSYITCGGGGGGLGGNGAGGAQGSLSYDTTNAIPLSPLNTRSVAGTAAISGAQGIGGDSFFALHNSASKGSGGNGGQGSTNSVAGGAGYCRVTW